MTHVTWRSTRGLGRHSDSWTHRRLAFAHVLLKCIHRTVNTLHVHALLYHSWNLLLIVKLYSDSFTNTSALLNLQNYTPCVLTENSMTLPLTGKIYQSPSPTVKRLILPSDRHLTCPRVGRVVLDALIDERDH